MADDFVQFSCVFNVGSAENAALAEDIRGKLAAELCHHEGAWLGFEMEVDHETGPGALWIHSDEYGEPEHVIRFVLRCADALHLHGLWGFTWGLSCSTPRLDAFGGGAQLLDLGKRESVDWIDCNQWLELHLAPDAPSHTAPDPETLSTADSGCRTNHIQRRPPVIKAECHSDDRIATARFDATPYFMGASAAAIAALADCGWAGDYAADHVAYHVSDHNEDVAFVLRYATCVPEMGFECSVDEVDARAWLAQHQPDALPPGSRRRGSGPLG